MTQGDWIPSFYFVLDTLPDLRAFHSPRSLKSADTLVQSTRRWRSAEIMGRKDNDMI
jgi:hypothetical protein